MSFLKKLVKGVGKVVGAVATGIGKIGIPIVSDIAGAAGNLLNPTKEAKPPAPPPVEVVLKSIAEPVPQPSLLPAGEISVGGLKVSSAEAGKPPRVALIVGAALAFVVVVALLFKKK